MEICLIFCLISLSFHFIDRLSSSKWFVYLLPAARSSIGSGGGRCLSCLSLFVVAVVVVFPVVAFCFSAAVSFLNEPAFLPYALSQIFGCLGFVLPTYAFSHKGIAFGAGRAHTKPQPLGRALL